MHFKNKLTETCLIAGNTRGTAATVDTDLES